MIMGLSDCLARVNVAADAKFELRVLEKDLAWMRVLCPIWQVL